MPPDQFGEGPLWRCLLIVGGGLLALGVPAPAAFLTCREPGWVHPEHRPSHPAA
ncbi:hypothetical protein [Streptomyces huasconensis]|uniref:hypothetical protein n=1 Tax=Streptomyces huasconensis TaxID=1854574 RepID=UPI00370195DC